MAKRKKNIGFVDYNLENFHSNAFLSILHGDLAKKGFRVTGGIGMREKPSRVWAEVNDIAYFSDPVALNDAVDAYMVLAPSNPEVHLELCRKVLPFGKPTYVDKTFAQDLSSARKIFALADKHRVPLQTTSALRYTNVQDYVKEVGRSKVKHMVAWGGGRSFGEYAIHPVELTISCMGPNVQRVHRRGSGKYSQLLLEFSGGRTAVVNVYVKSRSGYAATVTTAEKTEYFRVDPREMFYNTTLSIMDMIQSGKPSIPRKESLVIRRILDLAGEDRSAKGFVRV